MAKPATSTGSYTIARGVVPEVFLDNALRLIHTDLLEQGPDAGELSSWLWAAHWFPHLRHRPEIVELETCLPDEWRTGQMCDPQILLQFPHTAAETPEITFHTDVEPDWARARRYLRIVGVPLSPWRARNGGLLVEIDGETVATEVDPGDAVMMSPDLPHSGGVNLTGAIRYAVYFRYLSGEPLGVDERRPFGA
jgi:hypothetical protein